MTMRDLEREIVGELRTVAKNRNIRIKDIVEWSMGDVTVADFEIKVYLPVLKMNCVIDKSLYKGD